MEFELVPLAIAFLAGSVVGAAGKKVVGLMKRGTTAVAGAGTRMTSGVRAAWDEGIQEARAQRAERATRAA